MRLFGRGKGEGEGRARATVVSTAAPEVSVLVPVYNTEPALLRQCLDSLVGQTLRDLEIVAIDDGSANEAPSILERYAAQDPRIRVLSKSNSGYGDSMNKGVEAARGTWLGICEPDDYADRRMFADLLRAARKHGSDIDIVKSNFVEHYDGTEDMPAHEHVGEIFAGFPYKRPFPPSEHPLLLRVKPAIWTALYRRQMLLENGIRFSPTPGASFQDTGFVHQCWIAARRVVLLKRAYLHYRMDNAASSSKSAGKVFAICDEYDLIFRFLRQQGDPKLHLFGPVLNATRFDGYTWNYDRIANECHLPFAERWAQDMREQELCGLVDESLLSPRYRGRLHLLLRSPEEFCAAYPDGIDL